MRERLRIGEVAKLLGVTPKTLRHYEGIYALVWVFGFYASLAAHLCLYSDICSLCSCWYFLRALTR